MPDILCLQIVSKQSSSGKTDVIPEKSNLLARECTINRITSSVRQQNRIRFNGRVRL